MKPGKTRYFGLWSISERKLDKTRYVGLRSCRPKKNSVKLGNRCGATKQETKKKETKAKKNRKKRKRCFYCLDEEIYRCFSSPLVPHSFSFFFSFPSSPYSFCFCYLGLFFFFIFLFCFVFYRYRLGERKRPTLFGSFFLLLKFFFWFFFWVLRFSISVSVHYGT